MYNRVTLCRAQPEYFDLPTIRDNKIESVPRRGLRGRKRNKGQSSSINYRRWRKNGRVCRWLRLLTIGDSHVGRSSVFGLNIQIAFQCERWLNDVAPLSGRTWINELPLLFTSEDWSSPVFNVLINIPWWAANIESCRIEAITRVIYYVSRQFPHIDAVCIKDVLSQLSHNIINNCLDILCEQFKFKYLESNISITNDANLKILKY